MDDEHEDGGREGGEGGKAGAKGRGGGAGNGGGCKDERAVDNKWKCLKCKKDFKGYSKLTRACNFKRHVLQCRIDHSAQ